MEVRYSIGEMSKLFNIPVSTLRHYHNKGIFKAKHVDEDTNYRYYTTDQFELLNNIISLRYGKISLEDIKSITSNNDIRSLEEELIKQKDILEGKIYELTLAKESIEKRIESCRNIKNVDGDSDIQIIDLVSEKRFYIYKDFDEEKDLELLVRQLGERSGFNHSLVLGNVGLIMSKEIKEVYKGVYLKLEEEIEDSEIKEGGRYLVTEFKGLRSGSHRYLKKMKECAKKNNLLLEGDFEEVAIARVNEGYIRRIKIKIKS